MWLENVQQHTADATGRNLYYNLSKSGLPQPSLCAHLFYFGGIDASVIRMRTRPNSDLQKRLALWETRSTQKYSTEKERAGCEDYVRADKHRWRTSVKGAAARGGYEKSFFLEDPQNRRQSSLVVVSRHQSSSVVVSRRQSSSSSSSSSSIAVVSFRQLSSVVVSRRQSSSVFTNRDYRIIPLYKLGGSIFRMT